MLTHLVDYFPKRGFVSKVQSAPRKSLPLRNSPCSTDLDVGLFSSPTEREERGFWRDLWARTRPRQTVGRARQEANQKKARISSWQALGHSLDYESIRLVATIAAYFAAIVAWARDLWTAHD